MSDFVHVASRLRSRLMVGLHVPRKSLASRRQTDEQRRGCPNLCAGGPGVQKTAAAGLEKRNTQL